MKTLGLEPQFEVQLKKPVQLHDDKAELVPFWVKVGNVILCMLRYKRTETQTPPWNSSFCPEQHRIMELFQFENICKSIESNLQSNATMAIKPWGRL